GSKDLRGRRRRGIRLATDENAASRSPPGLTPAFRLAPEMQAASATPRRESFDFTPKANRTERVQTVNMLYERALIGWLRRYFRASASLTMSLMTIRPGAA